METTRPWSVLALIASLAFLAPVSPSPEEAPNVKKITSILMVEHIEPSLPFWCDLLGFQRQTEVPDGDRLGFVILEREGLELMLQSRATAGEDDSAFVTAFYPAEGGVSPSCLFLEVADIDELEARLEGVEVLVPKRKTFYGSTEIFVREPGGHVIGLAEFPGEGE